MTSFAPTFTPRWRGTYIAAGVQHTIQFRAARGATFGTMDGYKDRAREIFAAVAGDLAEDFSWVKAEIALTDSDVFVPSTVPAVTVPGTSPLSAYSPVDKIKALTLSGNSVDGRGRFSMYGLLYQGDVPGDIGADGLIKASEVAGLNAIVAVANTYFYGNGGNLCTWQRIATYKPNDHLLRLVRKGIIS